MKIKFLFFVLCAVTFVGSIWVKNPNRQKNIVFTPTVNIDQDVKLLAPEPGNEYISEITAPEIESENFSEIKKIAVATEFLDSKEDSPSTYEIFTGNSSYTGDDTEDNDAGNMGFEDDFPEAEFAYDDHAAEGYINYTESYAD